MKTKTKTVAQPAVTARELRSQIRRAREAVEQTAKEAQEAKAGYKLARKTAKQAKKAAKAARKHHKALTQELDQLTRVRSKVSTRRKPAKAGAAVPTPAAPDAAASTAGESAGDNGR